MDKVSIALVGCGGMAGTFHLPAIVMLKDELDLIAVCDRNLEAAEQAARIFGGRAYDDLDMMLDQEKNLDIVAVTVHGQRHHTVAIRAAEAKKHVIVEKPMAITLPCADAMINACRANGVKLEVTENYLRMPMDALFNKIVGSGILGQVSLAQVLDSVNSGSIDLGVHRYSQLREAAGGWPKAITGVCRSASIQAPSESDWYKERNMGDLRRPEWAIGMVEFDNGVVGKCEFLPLCRQTPVYASDLRKVIGAAGVVADDLWPNLWPAAKEHRFGLHLYDDSDGWPGKYCSPPVRRVEETIDGLPQPLPVRVEVDTDPPIAWENPVIQAFRRADARQLDMLTRRDFFGISGLTRQRLEWIIAEMTAYHSFARAVMDDTEPEYGAAKGRSDLELTLAMWESARLGRRLELPLTEITEHEKRTHAEFEEFYGQPIL